MVIIIANKPVRVIQNVNT